MVEAHGGLQQRIETTAPGPRTLRAVTRQGDADDAGSPVGEIGRPETQRGKAARTVALHEDMRPADDTL